MFRKNYLQQILLRTSQKRFSSTYDYDLAIIGGGPGGIIFFIKDMLLLLKQDKRD